MQYLGGKSRTYKQICAFLESIRKPNQPFVEPFCGACWVTQGMSGARYAADANKALITMWKALQDGWEPPEFVSEDEYKDYKQAQDSNDPMTAFIGFGCSFAGKWFDGYARSDNSPCYAPITKRSLYKKMLNLQNVKFSHKHYQDVDVKNCLIYCDPPYAGTKQYSAIGKFNTDLFWQDVRSWSERNTVVVSEYNAPEDFVCVKEMPSASMMRNGNFKNAGMQGQNTHTEIRTEKLFMHESQVHLCNNQN